MINLSATNSPDVITITVGSLFTKLYTMPLFSDRYSFIFTIHAVKLNCCCNLCVKCSGMKYVINVESYELDGALVRIRCAGQFL